MILSQTSEKIKVDVVLDRLDGIAATWHQLMVQSELGTHNLNDWRTYKLLLKERFVHVWDDPIAVI